MDLYPPVEERSESAAREYRSSLQFCIREVRELRCPRICFPPFHSCRGHTTLSKLTVRTSLVSIGRALCALPSANEAWPMSRSDSWPSASPSQEHAFSSSARSVWPQCGECATRK